MKLMEDFWYQCGWCGAFKQHNDVHNWDGTTSRCSCGGRFWDFEGPECERCYKPGAFVLNGNDPDYEAAPVCEEHLFDDVAAHKFGILQ